VAQIFLRNVIVINLAVEGQGFLEIVLRGESRLFDNFLYPAIKSLDHAVGLWMAWLYEAMIYIVCRAFLIKQRLPVGFLSPVAQNLSVNSLPLSVRILLMTKGTFLIRFFRKARAEPADFDARISMKTQRVALSMATKRYFLDCSSGILGRYIMSA
jgi:hypothetical protein